MTLSVVKINIYRFFMREILLKFPTLARIKLMNDQVIAVLIPCYNEEATIGQTVRDFRAALPEAQVYVYDNNSRDRTIEAARDAGAIVRQEPLQGKGNVLRRMFADIEADIYLITDGDATYDAASAPSMIKLLQSEQLDMVNGMRVSDAIAAYRPGHRFGNALFTGIIAMLFGNRFQDILSGYRVFSRRFVKSFPALSTGFEIETELTVHALELRMPVMELQTPYNERPEGSVSKLNTWRDGFRILCMIIKLTKRGRPLFFFSVIGAVLALMAVVISIPLLHTYLQTGLVPRFPTAILATGIMVMAMLSVTAGMILDTVTTGRLEMKRMMYLNVRKHEK